jgi:hypothetical protein
MSSKDDILLERIVEDLGVQRENAHDLVNLINILLKTNVKEELAKELKEIYEVPFRLAPKLFILLPGQHRYRWFC